MLLTDEKANRDVVDQLYWDTRVDANDVKVEVRNGNAILTGTVPSLMARRAAEQDAWNVDGVMSVENHLKVHLPEETRRFSDAEIGSNIADAFETDANLDSSRLSVTVADGFVTLEGSVDHYWKKGLAEDIASRMAGVSYVKNLLTVAPGKKIKDEIIAGNVVAALDRNSHIIAESVDVEVKDGVVTLRGEVLNRIAEQAAYDCALHTEGVVSIRNDLIIRPE
ncbi:MAG: transport-associated protein [Fibrobacteres bacterium]|nr:transport-associated protein [Fibrobacterota bacterium]